MLVGKPEGRNRLEYLDVEGLIILKRSLKNWCEKIMDRINLVQDSYKWWTLVNTVRNLQSSVTGGQFLD